LLREEDRAILTGPDFEELARNCFASSNLACDSGCTGIPDAIVDSLREISASLRKAIIEELAVGASINHVADAYLALPAGESNLSRGCSLVVDEFPAFVRFSIAYRIHFYFETSCVESCKTTAAVAPGKSRSGLPHRPANLTLIHFNDVYNVEPRKKEPVGGVARFVTRIREVKQEATQRGDICICLFSGDAFNPSLTSTVTRGRHMVPALNAVGIDAACYGNHDFDFGEDDLIEMAQDCNFPWLISNVVDKATGTPLANGKTTHMLEVCGRKIGLMGLIEHEWLVTLHSIEPEDVIFEDFCSCARRCARQLRDAGAELVIALTHMRVPNDHRLAQEVEEVDIILGGHDHHYEVKPVGPRGTFVLKSGTDFRDATVLRLRLPEPARRFEVLEVRHEEIVSSIPEAAEMKALVDNCTARVGASMDEIIGQCAVDLDCRFTSVRTKETNIGNFVTDVMCAALQSDIAMINSGTLRADAIIEKGAIKVRDLVTILPMLDELCLVQLSGAQLLSLFENSVSQYPRLEGRFLQVSGVQFAFDPLQPSGQRLQHDSVKIKGTGLDTAQVYNVCTLDFMRQGKDGFDALRGATCIADGEQAGILPTLIREYFANISKLSDNRKSTPEAPNRRSSTRLSKAGRTSQVLKDQVKVFAIEPLVEGRIVCLNPNAGVSCL